MNYLATHPFISALACIGAMSLLCLAVAGCLVAFGLWTANDADNGPERDAAPTDETKAKIQRALEQRGI